MAFLEGLTWGSQEALQETRAGMPIYSGSAYRFIEWKFKVNNRKRAVASVVVDEQRVQQQSPLISKIIDGLADDALKTAMDMTEAELAAPQAVDTLIANMEDHVSRYKQDESRELYKAGSRTTGLLTRQSGEPMTSYVARRRRWYKRLVALD